MERNSNSGLQRIVVPLAMVLIGVFAVSKLIGGNLFGSKSIESAEKYVNQQVYQSLGITCDKFDSDIIYKSKDGQLVAVIFYTEGSTNPGGSCCVYCNDIGYVVNSTKIMASEYPYKKYIDELKALFGI